MTRLYLLFFALLTLCEITFTGVYMLLYLKADFVVIGGFLIYLAGMMTGYAAYRYTRYLEDRKGLLDRLPS